tara:strand:- start:1631 stop:2461 length:831 start_codon:yes stop_codon:yes gene_type:complete
MKKIAIIASVVMVAVVGAVWLLAQPVPRNPGLFRNNAPDWELSKTMPHDVFTFVRIRYSSYGGRGRKWATDYPDADLNFSYRLQEMTSMKVHPDGKIIQLTDKELFDYPFVYMAEPGDLYFNEAEVVALRKYLLNGGFLMVDDFWGGYELENFLNEMKRVFPPKDYPKQQPRELPLEHPIFHCVFDLKEKPQLPSIGMAMSGRNYEPRNHPTDDGAIVHYIGLHDDKGRLMGIICHNTDLGDGWEREGEDPRYFREHSEPKAYPMGINIIYYALTH